MGKGPFLRLWLAGLTSSFGFHLLTASLPLYAASLGADDAEIGLLGGLVAVVALGFRGVAGWWIDKVGSSAPPLIVGAALYPLCALGYGSAGAVGILLAIRAISGVGIALFSTASQALAADLAPPQRRAGALSLFAIALTFAQGLGPATGVAVVKAAGYGVLFGLCVAVGVAGVTLAWPLRAIRRAPAVLRVPRMINTSALVPGILLLALMVTFGASFALLPVHASRRGLTNPGLVFIALAAGLFAAQSVAGRLADRFGRAAVILPSLIIAAAGMWAVAALSGWWLFVASAVCGIGLGAGQPALYALTADLVPPERRGSAMGTLGLFHEIGIGVGAIGGGVIARALGLGAMFGLAGLAPVLGVPLVLASRRLMQHAGIQQEET